MNCCKSNNIDNTNFILYADDTNIFVVGKTKEEAFSRANKVLVCNCWVLYSRLGYSLIYVVYHYSRAKRASAETL